VQYTATMPNVHNRISRFAANGDVAVPGSATIILSSANRPTPIHNGGAIRFGSDGMLRVSARWPLQHYDYFPPKGQHSFA